MNGYLIKSAGVGTALAAGGATTIRTLAEFADKVGPVLLGAPPVIGAGLGYIHSKATSPSKMDAESMQQAIELAELQEMEAAIRRENAVQRLTEDRGVTGERSLRI
jgi:hypothetical protein